ncbi:MAG TPA: cytochrome c [Candidatus Baltobacteraceae bacterium]|jgi:mono/diheme cytochrome c family protein|nr:cytochrome c [Candidatus Baltobacteraceae bacterium]
MSRVRATLFAAALLGATACTPATGQKASTTIGATALGGDRKAGARLFRAHCSACHGPTGKEEDGYGPSLRYESARMDFQTTVSWIEDPEPPMPELYPSALSENDVHDIAAYVQSI